MAKKPITKLPRAWIEDFVRTETKEAMRLARHDFGCGKQALDNLVEGNRNIAMARVHLSGIGPHSPRKGGRRRHLWASIAKAEKQLDKASDRFMRCTINKRKGR